MAPRDVGTSSNSNDKKRDSTSHSNDVAQAIRDLGAAARDAANSLTYAVHDAAATLNETVRSASVAILAALTKQQAANTNVSWPETDARYARANGGRCPRPVSEKTDAEKATLERMRARKAKDGEQ